MKNRECQTQNERTDYPNLSKSEKLTIWNYSYKNKITIRDNFQVVFHVGIDAQHLVNYDHRKVNKLVKHEILTHFQFNITLLLKIGRK